MLNKPVNLKESLSKLNEIVKWFEKQEAIDVEAGLEKIKDGASLVKACKTRLKEIENEFEHIKKDMDTGDNEPNPQEEPGGDNW